MTDRWQPRLCLDRTLAGLPLRRCHRAAGRLPPSGRATISDQPRLLVGLAGRCRMRFPHGAELAEVPFRAGDALLIEARLWNQPLAGDMSFLVCFVDSDHLRLVVWHQRPERPKSRLAIGDAVPVTLRHALQAAIALPADDEESLRACCEVMLRQLARQLHTASDEGSAGLQLWRQIMGWMDQHLGDEIDRTAACDLFGMHPNHLTRVFSRQAGEGFTACLIRKRMERALHLLRGSELPVAEVGRLCGYPDPSAFSAAVRRWHGRSPRKLR